MQLRYSECKCQKAKTRKRLVHIQRSSLVQNDAMKIGYVHTWNVRVQSLKAAQPCSGDIVSAGAKRRKGENGCTNSTKLVSTERRRENRLCTYLECACAIAKGGAAVWLRYSKCKCQKAKRRKRLYKFNEAC